MDTVPGLLAGMLITANLAHAVDRGTLTDDRAAEALNVPLATWDQMRAATIQSSLEAEGTLLAYGRAATVRIVMAQAEMSLIARGIEPTGGA